MVEETRETNNWREDTKMRTRRKMTEEQKEVASERLASCEGKRLRENPPKYSNIPICIGVTR